MGLLDVLAGGGRTTLLTGLEDVEDGALKVYISPRYANLYALVYDEEAKAELRRAWSDPMGHILIPMPPPEALYRDGGEGTTSERSER